MTAKEKAIEIYNQFKNVRIYISQEPTDIDSTMQNIDNDAVKECALILVNEIIATEPRYPSNVDWDDAGGTHQYYYRAQREEAEAFWLSVRSELIQYNN